MCLIGKTMNMQEKSSSFERLCTKTRFETEVRATRKWFNRYFKGATSPFAHLEKFNLKFSSYSLVGQDGWILVKFFFNVFMDRDEVEIHKLAKKNEANIQTS